MSHESLLLTLLLFLIFSNSSGLRVLTSVLISRTMAEFGADIVYTSTGLSMSVLWMHSSNVLTAKLHVELVLPC